MRSIASHLPSLPRLLVVAIAVFTFFPVVLSLVVFAYALVWVIYWHSGYVPPGSWRILILPINPFKVWAVLSAVAESVRDYTARPTPLCVVSWVSEKLVARRAPQNAAIRGVQFCTHHDHRVLDVYLPNEVASRLILGPTATTTTATSTTSTTSATATLVAAINDKDGESSALESAMNVDSDSLVINGVTTRARLLPARRASPPTIPHSVPGTSNSLRPIIVFICGSAWSSPEPRTTHAPMAHTLRSQGHIVVVPTIRRRAGPLAVCDMVLDIHACLRWLGYNAHRIGGDADNVFLMGYGAGAHLCLMTSALTATANIAVRLGTFASSTSAPASASASTTADSQLPTVADDSSAKSHGFPQLELPRVPSPPPRHASHTLFTAVTSELRDLQRIYQEQLRSRSGMGPRGRTRWHRGRSNGSSTTNTINASDSGVSSSTAATATATATATTANGAQASNSTGVAAGTTSASTSTSTLNQRRRSSLTRNVKQENDSSSSEYDSDEALDDCDRSPDQQCVSSPVDARNTMAQLQQQVAQSGPFALRRRRSSSGSLSGESTRSARSTTSSARTGRSVSSSRSSRAKSESTPSGKRIERKIAQVIERITADIIDARQLRANTSSDTPSNIGQIGKVGCLPVRGMIMFSGVYDVLDQIEHDRVRGISDISPCTQAFGPTPASLWLSPSHVLLALHRSARRLLHAKHVSGPSDIATVQTSDSTLQPPPIITGSSISQTSSLPGISPSPSGSSGSGAAPSSPLSGAFPSRVLLLHARMSATHPLRASEKLFELLADRLRLTDIDLKVFLSLRRIDPVVGMLTSKTPVGAAIIEDVRTAIYS
ncbi:hypothetical protein GQ42DRAFT_152287 [Ramicandelaber brevisporus]|nr:hypothetical protein GQ42DRAFT_152287 [Ramicandelaber brevisporus]